MAYSISEAAEISGVHIETIRYFERIGLISNVLRQGNGRRQFTADQVKRLRFIHRSRELGITQMRVRRLLDLIDNRSWTCDEVKQELELQLVETRRAIADLRSLERDLALLSDGCRGGVSPDCSALSHLFADNGPPK